MSSDSVFIPEKVENLLLDDKFSNYEPLFSNTRTRIFCASFEGKSFLLKTVAEDSPVAWKMLRREWELSMHCSHPNVIHVYSFERATSIGDCIAMEYVEGRDLNAFLRENPSPALRKRVMMQLLDAVGYLHSKGIVHNDIKPENILVSRADNDLKLIDLGLADDDIHQYGKACGFSGGYCSPELLDAALGGKSVPDCRSDIFSIGCIIQDIFGRGKYAMIARKCMKTKPDARFANVDAVKRAFVRRKILPYALAALVVCAGLVATIMMLSGKIVNLNETIATLENEFVEVEAVRAAERMAKENEKEELMREIDGWLEAKGAALKRDGETLGRQEAFVRLNDEYSEFFRKMNEESSPECWEECRRRLVSGYQELLAYFR